MLPREARHKIGWKRGGVSERLIKVIDQRLQGVGHLFRLHQDFVMIGVAVLRHQPRVWQLVVLGAEIEADRKRLDRATHLLRHDRDDSTGVEAAAEERAQRDVGNQAQSHAVFQQPSNFCRAVLLRHLRRRAGRGVPPRAHIDGGAANPQEVAGQQLPNTAEHRVGADRVSVGQVIQ